MTLREKQSVFVILVADLIQHARTLGYGSAWLPASWPPIAGLFKRSRPPAIARLVMAVDVDSVKREALRRVAHICHELSKVVAPRFTHRNAATAVHSEATIARVEAATLRGRPCDIGFSAPMAMAAVAMSVIISSAPRIVLQTPTTFSVPARQVGLGNERVAATITATDPSRPEALTAIRGVWSSLGCHQSAESLAGEILECPHGSL